MSARAQLGALALPEIATPADNPPVGRRFFYVKSDGLLYTKDSAGTETQVGSSAGSGDGFTTGDIKPTLATTASAGWLMMDNSQQPIATYTALYNLLTTDGTVFPYGANTNGSGAAGSTHFRLPDARDRELVGVGNSHALGSSDGLAYGTARDAAGGHNHQHTQAAHTHPVSITSQGKSASHTHGVDPVSYPTGINVTQSGATPVTGRAIFDGHYHGGATASETTNHTHGVVGNTTGASNDTVNANDQGKHAHLAVNYMIKT